MKKTLYWILGEGGLLGSHLCTALRTALPQGVRFSVTPFEWTDHTDTLKRMKESAAAFQSKWQQGGFDDWMIVWAAGTGIIGSSQEKLERETEVLRTLLQATKDAGLSSSRGTIFLASSAGALSPECSTGPTTEETVPEPISDYGKQKLIQEKILREWAQECPNTSVLIGRISNLYGAGQSLRKGQGLLSHLSKSALLRRPIHIYVSFDTVRDYIDAGDAAAYIVECLKALQKQSPRTETKIIASEKPVTIADILSTFQRITKRPLRTVQSVSPLTKEQRHHVYFRSVRMQDVRRNEPKPLLEGMAALHEKNRERLAAGTLA